MRRSDFFRSIAALALAPSLLGSVAGEDDSANEVSSPDSNELGGNPIEVLRQQISTWAGGVPVDSVELMRLAEHGNHIKYGLIVQAGQHTVTKAVVVSTLASAISSRSPKSDAAYAVTKRAREAARDLAYLWWGPDKWRSHAA